MTWAEVAASIDARVNAEAGEQPQPAQKPAGIGEALLTIAVLVLFFGLAILCPDLGGK